MDGRITQDIPDSTYNPEKDIIRNEVINTIHHTIDQLPKKYREVINLRHKQDKSYEEIAKELDLPIGTVKARIFRAREILKKSLRELNLR